MNMASQSNKDCCCLCGDVGFIKDLIVCPNCRSRLQHTYCSRFYPEIEMDKWQCEWCLYDQERKRDGKGTKAFQSLLEIAETSLAGDGDHLPEKQAEKKLRRGRDEEKLSNPKSNRYTKRQKLNCNSSSSRIMGRRYKLLADVLC